VTAVVPINLLFSIFSGLTTGLSPEKLSPFMNGMHLALWILAGLSILGAVVSAMRGDSEHHYEIAITPAEGVADLHDGALPEAVG
jgi:hypothetical protein